MEQDETDLYADEDPTPRNTMSLGGRILLALVALLTPPIAAAGLGVISVMLMIMAVADGTKDMKAAEPLFNAVLVSLGVFACCGVPIALGVLLERARKPLIAIGVLLGGAGLLGALVSAGLYLKATFG